jgi:mannose-1-phosphate guanylyltransferase
MRYAVIMAGGAGKRLWPASRENKPKQLIRLIGGKSLLELAVERLEGIFPHERVLVVTNAAYVDQVADFCDCLPRENIVGEPEGRDTANAIALAGELIAARDGDATMAVFSADHIIRPVETFRQCVERACRAAEEDPEALVTFGIRPTWPHTGLGYVHCGESMAEGVRRVLGFKEKPDHRTARYYVESGEYFWNSGMFVWRAETIRNALQRFLPDSARRLAPVGAAAKAGEDVGGLLAKIYPELPKISIDFAVMEKASHVLMVELTCGWLDVGSWPALADVLEPDADGNTIVANRTAILDGSRNVIFSEDGHLVAVVGMDDCIIVHTADVTLVCKKSDSQRLKELVDKIGRRFGSAYI